MRDLNTIRCLSRRHTVSLLSVTWTQPDRTDIDALLEYCERVDTVLNVRTAPSRAAAIAKGFFAGRPVAAYPYYFDELSSKIGEIFETQRIDVVSFEQIYVAGYLDALPREHSCRTVLSLHNIASSQYLSMAGLHAGRAGKAAQRIKAWLMGRMEHQYFDRFDHVIAVSEREADVLRTRYPGRRVSAIENGFDGAGTKMLAEPARGNDLLFVGNMLYGPNTDAVTCFSTEILPIIRSSVPDARLFAVGASPPEWLRLSTLPHLVITGRVDDVLPYYEQSRVAVVPLRAGGGTRLKILEAMAFGRPVVTTSTGCEGLEVRHREHLLIADGAAEFAECVVELVQRPELGRALTRNARQLLELRYDWEVINKKLTALYDNELAAGAH